MITLFKDENIVLIQRRHWFPFVGQIIPFIILAILPFIIFAFVEKLPTPLKNSIIAYSNYYFFFVFVFLFIIWLFIIIFWTDYYLDVLIITNKRIIDIEQLNLFNRDEAEMNFDAIEDIKVEIIGFLESFFKFGNIYIQSAGEGREFIIKDIPNPDKIKNIIAEQKINFKTNLSNNANPTNSTPTTNNSNS